MSIEELCEKVKLQGESRTHEDRVRLLSKAKLYSLLSKVTPDNKHDDKLPDVKGDELL